MMKGILGPAGKREVIIGERFVLTLENTEPIEWEIDNGKITIRPADDGRVLVWSWEGQAHDPDNPDTCYCEACVCKNYPDIARRHPNCKSASADVAYLKNIKGVLGCMIADHRWPNKEE